MERFRKYMRADLNLEGAKDKKFLSSLGITCTYLSEPLEDFDELEFRTGFQGRDDIVITVAVEMGKIKRVMFGAADEANSDVVKSMSREGLEKFLAVRGEDLVRFFEYISK